MRVLDGIAEEREDFQPLSPRGRMAAHPSLKSGAIHKIHGQPRLPAGRHPAGVQLHDAGVIQRQQRVHFPAEAPLQLCRVIAM